MRILCVEEEADLVELYKEELAGHEIVLALTLDEFKKEVARADIVLTEADIPWMNFDSLKEICDNHKVEILVVTRIRAEKLYANQIFKMDIFDGALETQIKSITGKD